jgi:23S rRNA (cytidine1920-2'-O)/16S rRNA (cytidine1409-2'-O)-methyltransferase
LRADQLLVVQGLASSRTLARRLIEAGRVHVDAIPITRPAESLPEAARLTVLPGDEDRYVSRGGLKLAGALQQAGLDVTGSVCLDVGQSTGGFTDCLLQAGAARVVGIDVGHNQLNSALRDHPLVTALEGINARAIERQTLGDAMPAAGFDLIVIDVSFISLTLVLPSLAALAAQHARLIALVKPQFEVGRAGLDSRGIVRTPELYPQVQQSVSACVQQHGWHLQAWFESPIRGGDGNQEFFIHAVRADACPSAFNPISLNNQATS